MPDPESCANTGDLIVDQNVMGEGVPPDPVTGGRSRYFQNPPLVSVVILNYNGQMFIRRCLETVLKSDYPNKEIILVDNASSDNSLQLAQPYAQQVTIIGNRKNYGFAKGCNIGIRQSHGSIVILLNVDTCVRPGWIEALVFAMLTDPTVGVAGSKLLFLDGSTIQHAGGVITPNAMSFHIGYGERDLAQYDLPREVDYVTGASLAVRRELLDAIGLLDNGFKLYYDDLDLAVSARRLGYKVMYIPCSVVLHFETFGTEKNSRKYYYKYHRGRIRFLLKNCGIRYILGTFLREEWNWYGMTNFRDQFFPLILAYLVNLPKAPYFLVRGFIIRRWTKPMV
ncbi:MAG TPA: glycosyltransferase family 2 protein [bacterium]|nr:glycosyltransferase family 2 protein [bacterium]HQL62290.1 glycosyltransferase family 2 protein [bacterium]